MNKEVIKNKNKQKFYLRKIKTEKKQVITQKQAIIVGLIGIMCSSVIVMLI